jgi:hypothetical protein
MASLFEGKCGPSVDEVPESIKIHYNADDDELDEFLERYKKDLLS